MYLENFISVKRIELTIIGLSIPSICEVNQKRVVNKFIYESKKPIPVSDIALSDLELAEADLLRGDEQGDLNSSIFMGLEGKVYLHFDGRYFGILSDTGIFEVLNLSSIELKKTGDFSTLYLEFIETHNIMSSTVSKKGKVQKVASSTETFIIDYERDNASWE